MNFLIAFLFLWFVKGLDLTCSSHICPDIIKGNRQCNPECMTSFCNYDTSFQFNSSLHKKNSDCYENCIFDGCDPQNLGNGICDTSCNTTSCGFDWGDCTCSPGCFNSMLGDGNCDEECDNWNCDLDNHDCGQCADGCFPTMLGNGICDSACNNEDCLFDYKDCQCAENCKWTDYGLCLPECMIANCNYDKIDQYPNNWCQNKSLAIFSSYQQIIRNDFSYVVNLENCYKASNYTCSKEKALNFVNCYQECNILECNYANGNCEHYSDAYCRRSYKNFSGCLTCINNKYQIIAYNFNRTCTIFSHWELYTGLFPDGSLTKIIPIDTSSAKNPHIYFVKPSTNSGWLSGNGTYFSQFSSLSYALANIFYNYSIIYLSQSNYYTEQRTIELKNGLMNSRYYDPNYIFRNLTSRNIKIKTLENSPITIKRGKDDISSSVFWFQLGNISNLEINNVIFDWKNTISSCKNDDYCDYCPVVTSSSDLSLYYNDRGEKINDFLSGTWCSINNGKFFFNITSSNLVLNNVGFINFRTDFNSIFWVAKNSNMTLNNVTFDNVKVYNSDNSAIIVWNSTGTLQFNKGTVSRVNNGYEIKDSIRMKGFLNVILAKSIVLRDVNFMYNVVEEPLSIAANRGALVFLNLFQMLVIDSCTFIYNYCDFGIINIQQQYNDFSNQTNDYGEIIYSTLNHIFIVSSNFTSNYGKISGVLYSYHKYESQNLLIENSSFTHNGIETGPLIYIESNYINQKYLSDIILNTSSANNNNLVGGKYLAKWVKIHNSSFVENYSGSSGILEVTKMINIDLKGVFMVSNGLASSGSMNANSIISKYYIENPDMYIKLNITDPPDLNCESLSSISDSINLNLDKVSILKNYCKNSLPRIIISNTTNSTISISNFENNSGSGFNGICLTSDKSSSMTIKDSFFISNQNNQPRNPGAIYSLSDLLLQNCTFLNNIADWGGALYFVGQNLRIISSYFDSNRSPNLNGAAIYYFLSLYDIKNSLFSITNTTFTNNSCNLNGGGIFISKSSLSELTLELEIDGSHFYNNKAYAGSSLFIDGNVQLSPNSSISNCEFKENKASFSGTIWIYYTYGILEINSCSFFENNGLYSSGLNIAIGENSSENNSKLTLNYCDFQFNTGNVTISLDDQNTNSTLEINYCQFEYNYGSVFSLDNGYATDKNSRIQHNYSPNSGGVLNLKNSAIFVAENAIYINCSSSLNGGVASLTLKSQYFCFSCKFTENSAESSGGVIYADSNAEFHIYSSIINKNSCKNRGSAIFMASVFVNSTIDNSKIFENYAYGEGTIALLGSAIFINSSEISNNSVSQKNPGIHLENSIALITNTSFFNQNGNEGCSILLSSSFAKIINSSFHDGFSSSSGTALHATSSVLKIFSSTFLNLFSNSSGGSIYLYESSNLTLKDSIFINTSSSIDSYSSFVNITNTSFTNYSSSCIYGSRINLSSESSYFLNGYSAVGAALYCSECNNISIISSEFSNNVAQKGGAIYLENQADHLNSSQCNINSSSFISNMAGNGGAIWTNNINLNIFSSRFDKNYAEDWETKTIQEITDGIGGAIKVSCVDSEIPCYFDISWNNFSNNLAVYKGGAISWDNSKPILENNNFWNNSALYGNDIASFPAMMVFLNGTNQRVLQYRRNLDLILNDIASGQNKNPPLTFALIDDISQIITTDCSSQAQLLSSSDDLIISGTSIANAVNGIFHFNEYIITAKPGSSLEMSVISSAIDDSKMSKSSYPIQMSSRLPIYVNLRLCEIGEATVGLECESCLENYYNIDIKNSKCLSCPSSANCYGNYTIAPKHGYWRDNKFTDHFWKCPYPPACLGSPDILNLSFTGKCAKGYENNMCHSCQEGYSRLYKNECQECPSIVSNVFRLSGIFSLLVFMVIVIIKTSRKSAFEQASLSSIYIKIFWNYLQIMIIIATFSLNWPYEAVQLFYIQTCMDYIGAQLFFVDCFLQKLYSKSDIYYYKILITSLTPFSLAFICLLLWLIIYAIKRKNLRELKDDYLSTFAVILFLIHPSITNTMFSIFSCKEINSGEYWLYADLGIRCWDYNHLFYVLLFALPTINIWVIAVPALCLIKLVKNRNKLEDISVKLRFGFLFNGYNSKYYYWEFLILYWKVILIILSVFFSNLSTNIQALTVALMLAIFLHTQAKNHPYCETQINKVEIFSIASALITIIAGLFFITDDLDCFGNIILLILLLLFNFLFIIYISGLLLMQISIFKKCIMILAKVLHIDKDKKYQVREDLDYRSVIDQDHKLMTSMNISSVGYLSELRDGAMVSMELDPFASENESVHG